MPNVPLPGVLEKAMLPAGGYPAVAVATHLTLRPNDTVGGEQPSVIDAAPTVCVDVLVEIEVLVVVETEVLVTVETEVLVTVVVSGGRVVVDTVVEVSVTVVGEVTV